MPRVKKTKANKKRKKQKGGVGTNGTLGTLIDNVVGLSRQTITTISETINLIDYVSDLDTNLNVPYSPTQTMAPGSNL